MELGNIFGALHEEDKIFYKAHIAFLLSLLEAPGFYFEMHFGKASILQDIGLDKPF